jgi:hypothetical protein
MLGGTPYLAEAAIAACALTGADVVELEAAEVRLGDIATLDCLAPDQRDRLQDRVVAALPAGATTLTLSREALATLVRRRVPVLARLEHASGSVTIRRAATSEDREQVACYAAAHAVAAGAPLLRTDVVEADCEAQDHGALRYDRAHGVLRAAINLAPGDALGRILPAEQVIDAGDEVSLIISIGPINIERAVEALQPTSAERVFVRDEDGSVFSAPLATEATP